MATSVFIGAMGFAVLLDVAMGTAIIHFFARFFSYPLAWFHYFPITPLIALFPDIIDASYQKAKEGRINDAHHLFPHYPIPMLSIALLGGLFIDQPFWGLAAAGTWLAHYVHDSCEGGFGLKWFWPFSDNRHNILGGKARICAPEEFEKLRDHHADLEQWLKLVYYKPTLNSIVELTVSAGILFFIIFFYHPEVAALVWMAMMVGGVTFWVSAKKYAL